MMMMMMMNLICNTTRRAQIESVWELFGTERDVGRGEWTK
jgi:hypothetical protein